MKLKNFQYESKWLVFYFSKCFHLLFEISGYFDNRPRIRIGLFFFNLTIILPFYNKWTDECDCPSWGISIHHNTFWLHKGGKGNMYGGSKFWTFDFPFFTKLWIRTSILLNDDSWAHDTRKESHDFWRDEWNVKKKQWIADYVDSYDNTTVKATVTVEEREWRPKWLTWTSLFANITRSIDVRFSDEVGKRKCSWKGGTIGCGYNLLPNEHPLDCLKRMELNRKF